MTMLLLNASNLHVGGGVQVATSVIAEIINMPSIPSNIVIWASDAVNDNLKDLGYELEGKSYYKIVNTYGVNLIISSVARRLNEFDAVLTIFGPLYVFRLKGVNICGFAQSWIINPINESYYSNKFIGRLLSVLKFKLQSYFFKRADHLVVELEHVRSGLLRCGMGTFDSIHVVKNCLSSLYLHVNHWREIEIPPVDASILKIGFVGRNYPHKNTRIFPDVINALRQNNGVQACIYVTFTDDEWAACSDEFRALVINVGTLSVAQCPSFYRSMDAVIFPSLLECFSATPLEAMAMEKPLFASDRPFNRDVCHEHAHYFDPLSPASAARAIAQVFLSGGTKPDALRAARDHAINFSSPKQRAEQYLALLVEASNKTYYELKGT